MPTALDAGLNQHVDRTADHDQVLDVVAPDEHQLAAPVDDGGLDHAQRRSRWRRKPGPLRAVPPKTKDSNAQIASATSAMTKRKAATARMMELVSGITGISHFRSPRTDDWRSLAAFQEPAPPAPP